MLTQGKGLNSIRWRFALASGVLTGAALLVRDVLPGHDAPWAARLAPAALASLVAVSACVAAITFAMATRLTRLIAALQRSTEALAAGRYDSLVDVDCRCEIGTLADSFRLMQQRLNANVLRMNIAAYTDGITGLPNRAVVTHLLEYALSPERRDDFRAAIVFIDLDGFKRINDTLGHDGGDELLRLASRRVLEQGLGQTLATIDYGTDADGHPCQRLPRDVVFARFAGDEFVAVLPGVTDREELARVGARVVDALRAPFRIKQHDVTVSASVGMAIAPDDTVDAAELVSFADLAMYSSKQAGKSCWRFFDKSVRDQMLHSADIEAGLRRALERDELVLHYQPKLDARSLAVRGVEALVRWQHPERGLQAPGAFIDIAEKTGLMLPLGQRVLELAARQAKAWSDAGDPRPVAVNVSPVQFNDPAFVEHVMATLAAAGTPPGLISIEITESMAMSDFDATVSRLRQLRAAGLHIAVDDFGIGFSNLSLLSRLPVDALKIDRSLTMEIGENAKGEAIIRAVLGMTQALGYRVIAEGIETEAQWQFLRDLGCDTVQGFLFARPMPAARLDDWLREHAPAPAAPPRPAASVLRLPSRSRGVTSGF